MSFRMGRGDDDTYFNRRSRMKRDEFLKNAFFSFAYLTASNAYQTGCAKNNTSKQDPGKMTNSQNSKPLAIAMWDFSWLERRWPGAGYEDWDQILDELLNRGY